ncbi:MAG: phospholipase D-like domain-containing protein [Prolixibacteraceae bacterium]|jgi:cardiolipin hydrolase|nr:phospholipase D-like domain-containing protein [Prolixibacteraceae bacterium]
MKILESITAFFSLQVDQPWNPEFPSAIVDQLNTLTNPERRALRSHLFNEAKRLQIKKSEYDVLDWLQECFNQIDKYTFRLHHVYFSPGLDIVDNLRDLIFQAKKTLDLCVFSITDERLSAAIKNSYNYGVKIRILSDDLKTKDQGSKLKWLKELGIPIKIDHSRFHMHNKFGIIDDRIIFTGSFNWTKTASRANQENLLVTTNHSIVKQYSDEFERLWEEMYKY